MSYQSIKRALEAYGVGQKSISIKQELPSWSTDLHYKIEADGKTYSARFLKENRSPNNVFGEITDEILTEQTKFCLFLLEHDVPFMRNVPALNGEPYTIVSREGEHYRFIMFEWIEGQHLTHCDKDMAWKFRHMARRFHAISATYKSAVFQKKSHLIGYQQFSDQIGAKIHSTEMQDKSELQDYLELANKHIETAKTNKMNYIIQSDLNPMNVLWDENRNIVGIVDFESIRIWRSYRGLGLADKMVYPDRGD